LVDLREDREIEFSLSGYIDGKERKQFFRGYSEQNSFKDLFSPRFPSFPLFSLQFIISASKQRKVT
jgi:hypothetical protein